GRSALRAGSVAVVLAVVAAVVRASGARAQDISVIPSSVTPRAAPQPIVPELRHVISFDVENVSLREALDSLANQSGVVVAYRRSDVAGVPVRITVHARRETLQSIYAKLLRNTGLLVRCTKTGQLYLDSDPAGGAADPSPAARTLRGVVTDAVTHAPVAGATITIGGTTLGAVSDSAGRYQIANAPSGRRLVTVRRLGLTPVTRSAVINASGESVLNFVVTHAASRLNEVVVTGTIAPTAMREVPTAVTVIRAEDIERHHLTRLGQIFRGMTPGGVAWDLGTDNYTNSIIARGTNTFLAGQSSVKIYLDGIELANDLYAPIDVSSIDHVELTRGPEASTLYGSNAGGGVMQIFTKRGVERTRPEIDARAELGTIESSYRSHAVLQQDYGVGVRGGTADISYNLGGSYSAVGEWAPQYFSKTRSAFAGATLRQAPITLDLTARYLARTFARAWNLDLAAAGYNGFTSPPNENDDLDGQTYGVRLTYSPAAWWRHNLVLGVDRIISDYYNTRPRPSDSLFAVFTAIQEKTSVAYNTSAHVVLSAHADATVTAGFDHYRELYDGYNVWGALSNSGLLTPGSNNAFLPKRLVGSNTGYFGQVVVGVRNALFITAGVRAEKNPSFGAAYGTAVARRFGVTYVRSFGPTTVKLRGSYGEGLVAPPLGVNRAEPGVVVNPQLGPEEQAGGDIGLDVFIGPHVSLSASYYSDVARGVIDQAIVDTSTTPVLFEFENIGRIKNSGLEMELGFNWPRVSVHGQFSLTNSIVRAVGPSYTGELEPGDRSLAVPRYSGGMQVALRTTSRTSFAASVVYIGPWTNYDAIAAYAVVTGTVPLQGTWRDFWTTYPAVVKFNASATRRIADQWSAYVAIDNIANTRTSEYNNITLTSGRSTRVGVEVRY
ncbi:MAG: TonB-dependent receptor, partial [Gemmatimonadaceae bacterium]|nr:TonB-dependent receptor [Gemmatimonadaceae bacterium]